MGLRGLASPKELRHGAAAKLVEICRREIGVDVHVQIERTARFLAVAVQHVTHARSPGQEVDLRRQQQRHAQVGVDVEHRRQVFRDTAKPPAGIELEPRQLRQPPVAPIALGSVGAASRALLLLALLRLETGGVFPAVAGLVDAREQGQPRRRREQLEE